MALVIAALTIHEAAHLFAAIFLNIKFTRVRITLFGFNLNADLDNYSLLKKILLFLSGPACNLAVYVIIKNSVYCSFAEVNMFLACVNLIPIVPLDGGNICKAVLESFLDINAVCRYMIMTNSFFIVCFIIIIYTFKKYLYFILVVMALKGIIEENRHTEIKNIRYNYYKLKRK